MHILRKLSTGLTAAAALALPTQAQAACNPEFVDRVQTVSVSGVEIGVRERAREDFTIRVRNSGDGECAAFLRIAKRTAAGLSDALPFLFSSGGRVLEVLPNQSVPGSTGTDLFIPAIPGTNNGRAVGMRLGIPTEWGLAAARYSDEFVVTLHDEGGALLDTMIVNVLVDIPPSVSMRIVGAAGTNRVKRINLGMLDPDATTRSDPFGLRIWSTSPYRVEFASENFGKLRKTIGEASIPYTLRMGGTRVELESANSREFPHHTSALGDFHPLRVEVEPFFSEAGRYSDRVTVSVSAI
ncbi:hypothetical protein [Erythrobacter sp. THAF29]|uniref:hypothetical protein n=1 Tax=Erythrobacter sp. THAF29 TaxID=2587851 RepID=UPI00126987B5|nr:hypothetical protein [Erythrobacter sp. THAF29]QFT76073.1 hypothetical protein FIU90_00825 [Erythrobacter sp. THAF29]